MNSPINSMIVYRVSGCEPKALVSRMMYLAWKASRMTGAGFLQNRGELSEDQVWQVMYEKEDYPGNSPFMSPNKLGDVYADYVAGRMMKFRLKWTDDTIGTGNGPWRSDYQSFCCTYPTFNDLMAAALKTMPNASADLVESVAAEAKESR